MENYLLEVDNKIVGTFDSLDDANLFVNSCLVNGWISGTIKLLVYKRNSCIKINEILVHQSKKVDTSVIKALYKKPITTKPINNLIRKENNEEKNKLVNSKDFIDKAQEKIKLQHNINLLKKQKERIEESKKVYENDLKLYNMFKKENNNIPEIFKKKYEVMKKLEEENRLTWEHFVEDFKHENLYNEHFGVTEYDKRFYEDEREEISIDSDIESSSDYNTSSDEKERN